MEKARSRVAGIFLGNTSAICELEASPQKRNCVIPFVLAAAKGKITSLDEDGCTCPGGAVGACFGDGFTRLNPNIHVLLSQGLGAKAPAEAPPMLKEGERFFCDAETALKWRNNMPFSDKAYPRVVFAPLSRWSEVGTPDLVLIFANADQISALVTMQGFHNGKAVNTLAPFGAACHSIVYAAEQIDKEEPYAIMGLFDISQRSSAQNTSCPKPSIPASRTQSQRRRRRRPERAAWRGSEIRLVSIQVRLIRTIKIRGVLHKRRFFALCNSPFVFLL